MLTCLAKLRCWTETATVKAPIFSGKDGASRFARPLIINENAQNRPESGTKQLYPLSILKKSKPPAKPEVLIFLIYFCGAASSVISSSLALTG